MKTATATTTQKRKVRRAATPASSRQFPHVHTLPAASAAFSTAHSSASQLELERQVMAGLLVWLILGRAGLVLLLLLVRLKGE